MRYYAVALGWHSLDVFEASLPLQPQRFRALREAKGLSQEDLAHLSKVGQSTITKLERGDTPKLGADVLERIALALDATTDYFYGRGFEGTDPEVAASHMSFEVFVKDPTVNDGRREQCRRVLPHRDAPRTARGWRSFAEMLDLTAEPTPPTSSGQPKLAVIPDRRSKSKT